MKRIQNKPFRGINATTFNSASFPICYGPEFADRLLDQWADLNWVELDFSLPGKPTDNPFIELFNSRFHQVYLTVSWFLSLAYARVKINDCWEDYNENRPSSSLGYLTPSEFTAPHKIAWEVA